MRKTLSLVLAVVMMLVLLPAVKLSTSVADEAATATYTQVTSAADLTAGTYIVADARGYAFAGTTDAEGASAAVTITDGTITGALAANELELAAVEGGYSLKNSDGKFVSGKKDANSVDLTETAVANVITFNDEGAVSIVSNERQLKLNVSGEKTYFRFYKETSNYPLPLLFKKSEATPVNPDPDPQPDPDPDPDPVNPDPEPETDLLELVAEPKDGDEIVIFNPDNKKVVTGESYFYEAKSKYELVAADAELQEGKLAAPDSALVLTVEEITDRATVTRYQFKTADGKYLYADNTDVKLVDEAGENTLFQLEATENGFNIKCDTAVYGTGDSAKAQYIEYYSGYFTVYSYNSSKAGLYEVQFYAAPEEEPFHPVTGTAIVLFTNDVHGGIREGWGYAGLADLKKTLEGYGNAVILVDAGDHSQGELVASLTKGEKMIDIMNAVGYDLAIPGNHEFDYGMDQFFTNVNKANYPYLSANFVNLPGGDKVFDAYKIIEAAGKKIAFVGLCTPESITKSTPTYFMDAAENYIYGFCQDQSGEGVYAAAQAAVDAAKAEGADIVIMVGHMGIDEQSSPWMSTEVIAHISGVDVFIDGHSHSVINGVVKDKDGKDVLHGQTGTKLANIGELTIAPDGTLSLAILPASEKVQDDPEIDAFIAGIEAEFEEIKKQVVAHTDHLLTTVDPETIDQDWPVRWIRNRETNLGDLCADAYLTLLDADVAFVNGGGIRANIVPGETGNITFEDIINVHPFGNTAVLAEVTGQQILDALEMGARVCPGENGGFLQVAGLKYEIHSYVEANVEIDADKMWVGPKDANAPYRVKNVQVLNKATGAYEPLNVTKKYKLASHNYMLLSKGDGMAMFGKNNITVLNDSGVADNQVLIRYIQSMPEVNGLHEVTGYVDPAGEGRIKIVTEAPEIPEEPEDLNPTFYGEAVTSLEAGEYVDGDIIYTYNIKVKEISDTFNVVGMQIFLQLPEALEFLDATTTLEGALGINVKRQAGGLLSFAWTAAAGDSIKLADGTTVLTLHFALPQPVANGTVIEIPFGESATGEKSGFSYIYGDTVKEAESVTTTAGSITFAIPESVKFYGEDVLSKDVSVIDDGQVLYRYDILIGDLPTAGLMLNSAQIFLTYDHSKIEFVKSEGFVDWTVADSDNKLMAVWASEEDVNFQNGVVLSLYFAKKAAETGAPVAIEFTTNMLGNKSAVSMLFGGEVEEIEATTVNGSITFTLLLGDANCDGKITSADAAAVLRAVVGLAQLSVEGALNADVDGDGAITAEDAAFILQYVVNLITAFPAEQP